MIDVKKAVCSALVCAALLPAFAAASAATPTPEMTPERTPDAAAAVVSDTQLSFGEDGTFTVLMLSDLQSTQFVSPHLRRALTGVLRYYPVDLIILLGDQLEGKSPVMRIGNDRKNARSALRQMLKPVVDSGVPFVAVFGNHDHDAPVSVEEQIRLLEEFPTYIGALSTAPNAARPNRDYVQSLPVFHSDGSGTVALNFYLFDCGPDLANGDYGAISKEQVAWYDAESQRLTDDNGGTAVPSVACSHIVLPEVYELFNTASSGAVGAMEGVGAGAGQFYLPDTTRIFLGEALEAPCPSSENNGLLDAFTARGDVFLSVSGHDHVNSFIGSVRGVDLASVPGATYTAYNERATRGVRLFRFREEAVRDYDTAFVPFSDYDGAEGAGAISYWLTTTTSWFYRPFKTIAAALIIGVILFFLLRALIRIDRRESTAIDGQPEVDDDYDADETEGSLMQEGGKESGAPDAKGTEAPAAHDKEDRPIEDEHGTHGN